LIAAGLIDMQQDPDGWDRHGSVGEIVSVLRNLLELLDVYSFGAPDLPNNKTQYILIGKKGSKDISQDKLNLPAGTPPTRIMTLIRTTQKQSSADHWLKPRAKLSEKLADIGYTLDRAPISVPNATTRQFLIEGGKVKGATPKPVARWAKENKKGAKDIVEFKPDKKKGAKPAGVEFTGLFLGEYPTWCPQHEGATAHSCALCEEAYPEKTEPKPPILRWIGMGLAALAILTALALLGYTMVWCPLTGCGASDPGSYSPPTAPLPSTSESTQAVPPATKPTTTAPAVTPRASYPGVSQPSSPATYPGLPAVSTPAKTKPPVVSETKAPAKPTAPAPVTQHVQPAVPAVTPAHPPAPRESVVRPIVLHVAFMEAKSNLTRETFNTLTAAATHAMQLNRTVNVRVFALGQRETDAALWQRRLYAVKDELVRLGVPVERIRTEGAGPYMIVIRGQEPVPPRSARDRTRSDLDTVSDPLANE
jgi:outer membrane protein OmpA-like peptidoglycan-associated protein